MLRVKIIFPQWNLTKSPNKKIKSLFSFNLFLCSKCNIDLQSMRTMRLWSYRLLTHQTLHSFSSLCCVFCQYPRYPYLHTCACLVAQLCLTLCEPVDCNLPVSFVHGILQARILEWSATLGSSWPKLASSHPLQADSLLSEPLGKPICTHTHTHTHTHRYKRHIFNAFTCSVRESESVSHLVTTNSLQPNGL